jgi:ubiquinone/menaquinone biosynthesis C-methylase UbiE
MNSSLYTDEYFARTDRWSRQPKYYEELATLLDRLQLTEANLILDIGCNTGSGMEQIRSRFGCAVIGLDYPKAWMGKCKVSGAVRADGHALPFPDSVFDAVFLIHVIGHVESPDEVISEAYRVLKAGGRLAILTPNERFVRMMRILDRLRIQRHNPDPTVLRFYRPEDLRLVFRNLPWQVEEFFTLGKLPHVLQFAKLFGATLRRYRERICCVARKP